MMLFRNTRRRMLQVAAICLLATGAFAHTGDGTFDFANFWPPAEIPAQWDKDRDTTLQTIGIVAEHLQEVQGERGDTLLPVGTKLDKIDWSGSSLDLYFTFPAGWEGSLTGLAAETCGMVIAYYFAESLGLESNRFFFRMTGEKSWRPVDDFCPDFQPSPELEKRLGNWEEESNEPPPQPAPDYTTLYDPSTWKNVTGQGPLGTSGMPMGALAGRTVFVTGGHGWTWTNGAWRLQRTRLFSMVEDYGNADMIDFLVPYLFNAGATVVAHRPIGYQSREVIVDNANANAVFNGTWTQSTASRYYGATGSFAMFSNATPTETATAVYTPNIPATGHYPVYTWANSSNNRVSGQLYKVRHQGGENWVRVNHRRVGRGWVYLGTYYFKAGSDSEKGAVVISNMAPPAGTTTGAVMADAIRFGNGVGSIARTGGISGYTRREEANNYWIEHSIGVGGASSIYASSSDDYNNSIGAPPKMSAQMRDDDGQTYNGDIFVGFHSNAANTTARGSVGLVTTSGGTPTNQARFAALMSDAIDADSVAEAANWPHSWTNRSASTLSGAYGEISNNNLNGEMCGSIIETAFHDNQQDAELLRDPRVRNVHGRAVYRALVRYFNEFNAGPLVFLPEPPRNIRAENTVEGLRVSWAAGPTGGANGGASTGYRVYTSRDGLAFDSGVAVTTTSHTFTGVTGTWYFRVAGTNAGGESLPSPVVGARRNPTGVAPVLYVDGYDRIDRGNNIKRFPTAAAGQEIEQLILARNNSYDYVRNYGAALEAAGYSFDSCDNESIIANLVTLSKYQAVIWSCGEESSRDFTFDPTERTRVTSYLAQGGSLFISGAEIGYELDTGPSALGRDSAFYNNVLMSKYAADDGNSYQATGVAGTILAGVVMNFNPGESIYDVDYPDVLSAINGSVVAANYTNGGSGGAVIQYAGGTPERRVVNFGFPFETINAEVVRNQLMNTVVKTYFGVVEPTAGPDPNPTFWMLQ